ncbi:MAG TPA: deoxyribodipyrimidine photo-lyase, partial [Spirochaetia bacterium]|nr:deoxyribodipyrimidine photo-lyase [Spirochaetia bacterium]
MTAQLPAERVAVLHDGSLRNGAFVVYWMQASQRVQDNAALAYAVTEANARRKPVLVCFVLTESYPGANLRHYQFMLEGIAEI